MPLAATGLSKYRVSTQPRDAVPLGSCTASSPSPEAYGAAQQALDAWRASDDADQHAEVLAASHRARLRAAFELPDDTAVALTPSGTDAIYLVSHLLLSRFERVHHVVVGANELGGGTLLAARGLAIADEGPFASAPKGSPLPGLADRCTAEPVHLREADGTLDEPAVIDAAVEQRVLAAPDDAAVVVHLVAHSKTGLRAPSTSLCRRLLSRLGDRLLVLVDAAQGRVAPRDVRHALDLGLTVLFTGSKFYSGPPFSGALLFPAALSDDPGPLPEGMRSWLSAAELPSRWSGARRGLVPTNPGLLLRWSAALWELEAYHTTVPKHRAGVYHTFAGAVYECFGPSDVIELDVPRPPVHELATALGAFPSVFCFRVMGPDGPLDADALKRLHAALDTPDERWPGVFHLGQPVPLGPPDTAERQAVLRVALGARLVRQLAPTDDLGASWFRDHLRQLRTKLEGLVQVGLT
jgi:hypothetical protein